MAVVIRLSRYGRLHLPYYRVIVCDKRVHREGVANEVIGSYEPTKAKQTLTVDAEKLKAWVAKGARISEALVSLLKHSGYDVPVQGAGARAAAKKAVAARPKAAKQKKGTFVPATRRSKLKHAAKLKAARKAAAAAAAPAADSKPAEAAS
jgi:small subunit ribosomal protein S16